MMPCRAASVRFETGGRSSPRSQDACYVVQELHVSIAFPRREPSSRAATVAERDTIWLLPVADFWAVLGLLVLTAIVSAVRLHYDIWIGRTDLLTAYLPGYAFLGDQLRSF